VLLAGGTFWRVRLLRRLALRRFSIAGWAADIWPKDRASTRACIRRVLAATGLAARKGLAKDLFTGQRSGIAGGGAASLALSALMACIEQVAWVEQTLSRPSVILRCVLWRAD